MLEVGRAIRTEAKKKQLFVKFRVAQPEAAAGEGGEAPSEAPETRWVVGLDLGRSPSEGQDSGS